MSLSRNLSSFKNNFNKFSNLEIFVIIFSLILAVGYITKHQFSALLFFMAISFIINKFTKFKLALSLFISIILTNLLISLNFFYRIEGNTNMSKIDDIKAKLDELKKNNKHNNENKDKDKDEDDDDDDEDDKSK